MRRVDLYTYIYHMNQPKVGTHTSPMDGMVWVSCQFGSITPMSKGFKRIPVFIPNNQRFMLRIQHKKHKNRISFPFNWPFAIQLT